MYLKLYGTIRCRYWDLSSAISPAIHNPLPRRQSATKPLYAIYYLVYSTVLGNEKKEIKQEWKEGPEMFYSTLLAMAFTYVRGPPAGHRLVCRRDAWLPGPESRQRPARRRVLRT